MPTSEEIAQIFTDMVDRFVPDKAKGVDALIQFDLSGDAGGLYWIKINDGECTSGEGEVENPRMTLKASAETWHSVSKGEVNVMKAFMGGKLKVKGDMNLGMKLQSMFGM